jgi:hypothetical protein
VAIELGDTEAAAWAKAQLHNLRPKGGEV